MTGICLGRDRFSVRPIAIGRSDAFKYVSEGCRPTGTPKVLIRLEAETGDGSQRDYYGVKNYCSPGKNREVVQMEIRSRMQQTDVHTSRFS